MSLSRFVQSWFSDGVRSSDIDRQELTVAVLVGAKSLIRRGWLQGGWYVLEAPDGRRRSVGAGSLTRRSYGMVVQACVVGAVAEAARWHSPERGTAGSAIDALWNELLGAEGRRCVLEYEGTSPAARRVKVRELTRWNDHPRRTRDDVLRLLDAMIGSVAAERSGALLAASPAPAPSGDDPARLTTVGADESAR
jgi:hypothetical protein